MLFRTKGIVPPTLVVVWIFFTSVPAVQAVPTELTARVLRKGAKFIGTSMMGARVLRSKPSLRALRNVL